MDPLTQVYQRFGDVLAVIFLVLFFGGAIYAMLRKSEDPARTAFKLAISAVVIGWTAWMIRRNLGQPFDFYDLSIMMICAFVMIVLWRHEIAGLVARPIENLFTGGDIPPEPKPYYSIAEARRKLGRYPEAVAEIRKQLEKFPTDFTGQMMLAEIQAQNLDDLPGAELTIRRLIEQPGHAPITIAHALSSLADWHLKYAQDREAARADLQKIIELIPGNEQALVAEQRIAHLASTEKLLAPHDRQKYTMREGVQNLGLRKAEDIPKLIEADTDGIAADYVKHLVEYPLDFEVREKLALIYADHYHRLDLATDQLEQMIEAVNQPKKIVHWLNLLADLQVRHGADYNTVGATLQRILDRFPNMPGTEVVRTRLSHLKLEFKSQTKGVRLKMGTYEQNIGLKGSKQY
jgi:tetratricopeptide (TPR) repeat protein